MRPFLFNIGPIKVPAFFFMVMVAALSATFYAYHLAKKEKGIDPVVMLDFGIIGIIASVIGSRILHILVENPSYYIEDPMRVFYFWQGGFVSLGAYLFTMIGWLVYLKWRKLATWRYLDVVTLSVPIIIFFVRIGCFSAGCCYGKPTDFFLHITFHNPAGAAGSLYPGVPLHPTQLYNMANALVMFFVLRFIYKRRHFYGQVFASFFLYYGVTRFFIEFLRGDTDRGLWFNDALSSGQIAMIIGFLFGLLLYAVLWKRQRIARS